MEALELEKWNTGSGTGSVRLPDKKLKYFLCNGFGFCFWNQKQCAENQGIRSWRREGVGAN